MVQQRWCYVAIESPRVGPSGRSENGGLNPATLQLLRIVVRIVSRTSRRWQRQTHCTVRSPFFEWHVARETRTHSDNKGDAGMTGLKRG